MDLLGNHSATTSHETPQLKSRVCVEPPRRPEEPSMPQTIGKELSALSDITEFLLEAHSSVPAFLRSVLVKMSRLIPSDLSFVGIVEESDGAQWIVVRDPEKNIIGAEAGEWQRYIGRLRVGGEDLPQESRSFVGIVAHSKELHRSDDVTKEPFYRTSNDEIRSELAIPVLFQDEVLAVINLESKAAGFFTEEHEYLLRLLAKLIAPPLHNLMISHGLRRPFIDVLEKIAECVATAPVAIPLAATGVLNKVASILGQALKSDLCQIWLPDADGDLVLQGVFLDAGLAADAGAEGKKWAGKAMEQGRLLRLGPSYDELDEKSEAALSVPALAAPMFISGRPIGAIVLAFRRDALANSRGYYSGADEHLINIVQGQIASAIEFKHLEIARQKQSHERARQLSQIARIFARLDLSYVLEKTVLRLPELCKGRYCSVFLWDETRKQFVLAASKGLTEKPGEAAYYPGEGLTGWVGLHGKPLLLDSRTQSALAAIDPNLVWRSKYNEARTKEDKTLHPFAAVPIFGDGRTIGVLRLSERTEGAFTESDELVMMLVADKISTAIAYSERYEERIRLLRGLQTLMTVTRNLYRADADIQAFKSAFLREAARTAHAAFRPDSDAASGDELLVTIYGAYGETLEYPPIVEGRLLSTDLSKLVPRPCDVPSHILAGGGSKYWSDARSEPLLAGDTPPQDRAAPSPRFVEREGIISSAGIRLKVGDKPVGVLFLNYRVAHSFDDLSRELIEAFGTQVALSLETAALYAQVRESASREEATALRHELHDIVNVLATGVVSKTGTILDRLMSAKYSKSKLRADLRSVEKYGGSCIAELREVVGELEPGGGTNSWGDLLKNHIAGLERADLRVSLDLGPLPDVPANVNRHLYLIARELFSNVLMHANASRVSIHAEHHDDRLFLVIQDDGIGFDPAEVQVQKPSTLGLRGIRRRVSVLNGSLEIDSRPGGTLVAIDVPIPAADRGAASLPATSSHLEPLEYGRD